MAQAQKWMVYYYDYRGRRIVKHEGSQTSCKQYMRKLKPQERAALTVTAV